VTRGRICACACAAVPVVAGVQHNTRRDADLCFTDYAGDCCFHRESYVTRRYETWQTGAAYRNRHSAEGFWLRSSDDSSRFKQMLNLGKNGKRFKARLSRWERFGEGVSLRDTFDTSLGGEPGIEPAPFRLPDNRRTS